MKLQQIVSGYNPEMDVIYLEHEVLPEGMTIEKAEKKFVTEGRERVENAGAVKIFAVSFYAEDDVNCLFPKKVKCFFPEDIAKGDKK